jgi:hypothetical protein
MAPIHIKMREMKWKNYEKQHNILQKLCVIAANIPNRNKGHQLDQTFNVQHSLLISCKITFRTNNYRFKYPPHQLKIYT